MGGGGRVGGSGQGWGVGSVMPPGLSPDPCGGPYCTSIPNRTCSTPLYARLRPTPFTLTVPALVPTQDSGRPSEDPALEPLCGSCLGRKHLRAGPKISVSVYRNGSVSVPAGTRSCPGAPFRPAITRPGMASNQKATACHFGPSRTESAPVSSPQRRPLEGGSNIHIRPELLCFRNFCPLLQLQRKKKSIPGVFFFGHPELAMPSGTNGAKAAAGCRNSGLGVCAFGLFRAP